MSATASIWDAIVYMKKCDTLTNTISKMKVGIIMSAIQLLNETLQKSGHLSKK